MICRHPLAYPHMMANRVRMFGASSGDVHNLPMPANENPRRPNNMAICCPADRRLLPDVFASHALPFYQVVFH